MQTFLQDLRYALRQYRKAPSFTLVAVLSLTLGIGATTAVFSIVYATLLHPYPFRDWERLSTLSYRDKGGNIQCCLPLTGTQVQQLQTSASIEELVASDFQNMTTTGGDLPEDVNVVSWSPNATAYFGVPPVLGRGLAPSDISASGDPQPVAALGYLFWQRHFGGNPAIVGQSIELAHKQYQIVGVMSPHVSWGGADVFLPLKLTGNPGVRLFLSMRLKSGVSFQTATAELKPLLETFAKETPNNFPQRFSLSIQPLSYGIRTALGPPLSLLFGAVCLLLVIGCVNVSILLMARGTKRQYELAVRAAMGAARSRVLRQLLTESLLLAAVGEGFGIALAYGMQKFLIRELPSYLTQRQALIHLNLPVLSFSIVVTLLTVLCFGLLPALQFSRREPRQSMQLGSQKLAGGWGKQTRNVLIAGQIALSLMLLAASATSIRAFARLLHANLGYDPSNTAALVIPVHPNSYTTWQDRAAYFDRLQQKIASTPDVTATALSIGAVPPNNGWNASVEVLGQNLLGDQQVSANFVSHDYFGVLHIPLLQGRVWKQNETTRAAHVAVINQTMARQYWPNGDAIGKQIRFARLLSNPPSQLSAPASDDWMEIIGIMGDALNDGLRNPVKPAVYLPYPFRMPMFMQILARTRDNPLSHLRTFRAQVQAVDSEQQIMRGTTSLEEWITQQDDFQREHMVAILFGAFSLIALVLAGVGLYSVVSYTVAQRTNEFALRMALGAQRKDVLLNLLFSISSVVAAGVVAGIGIYLPLKRIVAQLADASGSDSLVFALVTPLLLLVAGLASYLPARRATSLDPMTVLRHE